MGDGDGEEIYNFKNKSPMRPKELKQVLQVLSKDRTIKGTPFINSQNSSSLYQNSPRDDNPKMVHLNFQNSRRIPEAPLEETL